MMSIGLTALSRTQKNIAKLNEKKEKNALKISDLENDMFVIGRESRLEKARSKSKDLDKEIIEYRRKAAELLDKDLMNQSMNWLRGKTGAKKKEYSKEFNDVKSSDGEASTGKTDNDSAEDSSFTSKINPDTASPEEIETTQGEIISHLEKIGQPGAAFVAMDSFTAPKKTSENAEWATKDEVKKLSDTNEAILEELKTISDNMIDEQDTSIDAPIKLSEKDDGDSGVNTEVKEKEGWLAKILAMLAGGYALFKGYLGKFLGNAGLALFKLFKKPVDFVADMFKRLTKPFTDLIKDKLKAFKLTVAKMIGKALRAVGIDSDIGLNDEEKKKRKKRRGKKGFLNKIKNVVTPNSSKDGKKKVSSESIKSDKVSKSDKKSIKQKAQDVVDKKIKKETSKKTPDIDKKKTPDIDKKKTPDIDKKSKIPGMDKFKFKLPPGVTKAARFLGPMAAAGVAVYAGAKGYLEANDVFNLPKGTEATTQQKIFAGVGGIAEELSFGFISREDTAAKLYSSFGTKEKKDDKAEKKKKLQDAVKKATQAAKAGDKEEVKKQQQIIRDTAAELNGKPKSKIPTDLKSKEKIQQEIKSKIESKVKSTSTGLSVQDKENIQRIKSNRDAQIQNKIDNDQDKVNKSFSEGPRTDKAPMKNGIITGLINSSTPSVPKKETKVLDISKNINLNDKRLDYGDGASIPDKIKIQQRVITDTISKIDADGDNPQNYVELDKAKRKLDELEKQLKTLNTEKPESNKIKKESYIRNNSRTLRDNLKAYNRPMMNQQAQGNNISAIINSSEPKSTVRPSDWFSN